MRNSIIVNRIGLLFLILLMGCFYRVGKVKDISGAYILQKEKAEDYIIVHEDDHAWHLANIVNNDSTINGSKEALDIRHQSGLHSRYRTGSLRSYKGGRSNPGNEIHIFVDKVINEQDNRVSIKLSDISRIEVYDPATGPTVAIIAGSVVAASAIFLAIACSCPNVYTYNGSEYLFQGAVFAGAINANQERDDYLPLPRGPGDNLNYKLKLANERPETEFINFLGMEIVQHPRNSQVVYSKYGEQLVFVNPGLPQQAHDARGKDILAKLKIRDNLTEGFNTLGSGKKLSEVVLQVDKPIQSTTAKLLLRARNTSWMDYTFKQFFSLFGDKFEDFKEIQKTRTAVQRIKWLREQGVVLNVYLDYGKGWEYYDYFNIVGSSAARDIAMNLRLERSNKPIHRIKLESGFGFWEIDYVGIDLEPAMVISTTAIAPSMAINSQQQELINSITSSDDQYIANMHMGEEIEVEFTLPQQDGVVETSFFLHSRGYYDLNYSFKGEANVTYLKKFRKKGRFSSYSRELYDQLLDDRIAQSSTK